MTSHRQGRPHYVIYELNGAEVARYMVTANSERDAERQTSPMFFRDHPEFDGSFSPPGLKFRIETANA